MENLRQGRLCIPLSSLWCTLVIRLCGRIRWINGCLLLHPGKNKY
jgi:hypothetical protein